MRVSMVGFDDGKQEVKDLDGKAVASINPDLSSGVDVSQAKLLAENLDKCFKGVEPAGAFDIPEKVAKSWLTAPNPNGESNADVLKLYIGAKEVVQKPSERWLIDFNQMIEEEAQEYILPFAHVLENVKPVRDENRREARKKYWWIHGESRPRDAKQARAARALHCHASSRQAPRVCVAD